MTKFKKIEIGLISLYKGIAARGFLSTFAMLKTALLDENQDKGLELDYCHEFIDPSALEPEHPSSTSANYYQPIRTKPFLKLLNTLKLDTNQSFVDIGCGVGKAMILAAQHGFVDVKGIEYIDELYSRTKFNIDKLEHKYPGTKFEVRLEDARNYRADDRDGVFLLNDPFDDTILKEFLVNLKKYMSERDLHFIFIYKNNNDRFLPSWALLNATHSKQVYEFDGNFFEVYR